MDSARWRGMRVGLLGGTFNPPHAGHLHASDMAMKYLGLDAVWWLVTPGNPLKSSAGLPPHHIRMEQCRALIANPRIIISDVEQALETRRTYDTIRALQKRFPHTDFIWCAGTDIAHQFPQWYQWRQLQRIIPFAFVGRPHALGHIKHTVFRNRPFLHNHYPLTGGRPPLLKDHIYWILNEPMLDISSTALRLQESTLL